MSADDRAANVSLRAYRAGDEAAAIALWQRSWQHAYPQLDFAARLDWWTARWREDLVRKAAIIVAEQDQAIIGFVTVEPDTGYLDQIVVAPEHWGIGIGEKLLSAARRVSPRQLSLHVNADNARAIGFYKKRGFVACGTDVNPRSGAPVQLMRWAP